MHRARFVIQNLEKEGRDNLLDYCEVGVRQFSDDRLELIEEMEKNLSRSLWATFSVEDGVPIVFRVWCRHLWGIIKA